MAEEKTTLQTKGPAEGTLKWYLEQPAYKARFAAMLKEKAPQFMASIINIASARNFAAVQPTSILAAAAVAATLDLPVDKNLGFCWIIPYKDLASFQLGYKGWIQLALRSGQYKGMNAFTVNKEALGGYDEIGDPIINFEKLDETAPAIGYAFAWKTVNGFSKIVYWPKAKMEDHAKRYSQAYKAQRKDSPWFSDFDKMALKTVIANAIRKWGIVSIEMQTAVDRDQSAAYDIDAEAVYIDNEPIPQDEEPESQKPVENLKERLREQKRLEQESDRLADEAHAKETAAKAPGSPQDAPAAPKAQDSAEPANPQPAAKSASQPTLLSEGEDDDGAAAAQRAKSAMMDAYEGAKERGVTDKTIKDKLEMKFGTRAIGKIEEDDYQSAAELMNGLGR